MNITTKEILKEKLLTQRSLQGDYLLVCDALKE